jgi:hypothetical protein
VRQGLFPPLRIKYGVRAKARPRAFTFISEERESESRERKSGFQKWQVQRCRVAFNLTYHDIALPRAVFLRELYI